MSATDHPATATTATPSPRTAPVAEYYRYEAVFGGVLVFDGASKRLVGVASVDDPAALADAVVALGYEPDVLERLPRMEAGR